MEKIINKEIEEAKQAQTRYELRMEAMRLLQNQIYTCNVVQMSLEEIEKEIIEERRKIFQSLGIEEMTQEEEIAIVKEFYDDGMISRDMMEVEIDHIRNNHKKHDRLRNL